MLHTISALLLPTLALAAFSAVRPLPRAKQQLGYQFYAALPIASDLHEFLTQHYTLLAEVDSGARATQTETGSQAQAELAFSHAIFDSIARRNYDNAREKAHALCAERTASLRRDPCTDARFSPFDLVCELTIVVDGACAKARGAHAHETYDNELAALLDAESAPDAFCGGDGAVLDAERRAAMPEPEQSYEEFAQRRAGLRRAARRLSSVVQ